MRTMYELIVGIGCNWVKFAEAQQTGTVEAIQAGTPAAPARQVRCSD